MKILVAILALTPATALAETIITATEFEAFSKGTTVYFNRNGEPYGAEQYKEDRKVIWTFLDGRCERGVWYEAGDQICFAYETQSEPQCWHFLETDKGKSARVVGADPANDLVVVGQDKRNLECPGPGIGVSYSPASIVE